MHKNHQKVLITKKEREREITSKEVKVRLSKQKYVYSIYKRYYIWYVSRNDVNVT